MLNPREVQDAIDDVLGNNKDPMRLTRDFLKQVGDYSHRVSRLENKLKAQIHEKDQCGGWASALAVLEKIEETERLVSRAKELYAAAISETVEIINRLDDADQRVVVTMRYVECISDWSEIAGKIGKPKAEVRRIHTMALLEIKRILDEIEEEKNAE